MVAILLSLGGHEFWPDDITLFDNQRIDISRLLDSGQVTDTYLLALAHAHGGKLATFDRRLVTDAVVSGSKALHLIV
jgi:predicted nucleic acid-binding protein